MLRPEVGVGLVRSQGWTLEVGDGLVEDRGVACKGDVAIHRVWQPEAIVRDSGTDASTGWWMPPVLDVSFHELALRGSQQMFPRQGRFGSHECDDVLELVAEAVCAPGLVERRPCPQPAREGLIDKPVVKHDVHRAVWGAHLDGSKGVIPEVGHVAQCRLMVGRSSAANEVGGRRVPACLAEPVSY